MSKYAIGYGIVQQKINIGRLNKKQTMFLDDKEDHTLAAVEAVGAYLIDALKGGGTLELGDKVLHIEAHYEEKL